MAGESSAALGDHWEPSEETVKARSRPFTQEMQDLVRTVYDKGRMTDVVNPRDELPIAEEPAADQYINNVYHGWNGEFIGFPTWKETQAPKGLWLEDYVYKFPNHVRGQILADLINDGWTRQDLLGIWNIDREQDAKVRAKIQRAIDSRYGREIRRMAERRLYALLWPNAKEEMEAEKKAKAKAKRQAVTKARKEAKEQADKDAKKGKNPGEESNDEWTDEE